MLNYINYLCSLAPECEIRDRLVMLCLCVCLQHNSAKKHEYYIIIGWRAILRKNPCVNNYDTVWMYGGGISAVNFI